MNSTTAERLLEINRRFYTEHSSAFSETRGRVQPGVKRILGTFHGTETVLDLGCGNGTLAVELARKGHRGRYLGVDFSPGLLDDARGHSYPFPVTFFHADLGEFLAAGSPQDDAPARSDAATLSMPGGWGLVTAFALLHHISGRDNRITLLRRVRQWLASDGRFIHSTWQITSNPRLQERIRPWSLVDVDTRELEEGDHLVDWRRGGTGLRYVHEFNELELSDLAAASGFGVRETFLSDGVNRRSGLYQIWIPA